jgi:hypothetical protein
MESEIVLVQARIKGSVVERIKSAGFGKFAIGLYILLAELDKLQGTAAKFEAVVLAPKGGAKPARKEDPLHPGETYQQRDKRVREAHANSPDVRLNKIRSAIEQYIVSAYHLHGGAIDEDTMFEQPTYDSKGGHTGYLPEVRIMDHITPEERDAWVLESVKYYREREAADASSSQPKKPTGQIPILSADSKHGYQNFPALLANLSGEQIEAMNAECDGMIYRGVEPLEPNN